MDNSNSFFCRSCGYDQCKPILDLGETPLANSLIREEDLHKEENRYPLILVFCPNCKLVQITETVPPKILFQEYVYFSSFSETTLNNARQLVEKMIPLANLSSDSLVVEIASNDGYLLKNYINGNIPVLGIEPAQNIARVANQNGINTTCEFFSSDLARKLISEGKFADVIHANNVLAHVANLNDFVSGISALLKENGIAVLEFPYLKDLIDKVEFDTIYHEHLCYFSLTAICDLFKRHFLTVVDVERISIHGGSLRVFAKRQNYSLASSQSVQEMLELEKNIGMGDFEYYEKFGGKVNLLGEKLRQMLVDYKRQGKRIVVYGASAKGSTLLNFFNIGLETLDYVVDRSAVKQGLYTPGIHLKIFDPARLLVDRPDLVLLLTWNFEQEIMGQQHEYLEKGGHFIVPIPEPKIV